MSECGMLNEKVNPAQEPGGESDDPMHRQQMNRANGCRLIR
jgi:hypothetical protein